MMQIQNKSADCRRSLIIPVEVQHREFPAKLHLAAVAAARGCEVFIGDQNEIIRRLAQFPNSIYLDKSIAKTKLEHFKRLRSFGHVPVALCEEGLVYRNAEAYLRERVYPACFELVERFYMWGRNQRDDVAVKLGESSRLKVTGNPRFDLLRPELREMWRLQAEEIKSRFGPFILINSNFSRAARVGGSSDVVELLKKRGTLGGDSYVQFYRGWMDHLGRMRRSFVEMLPVLARALSPVGIIVRPHPSEDDAVWKEAAAGLDNVTVILEGSAVPWMIAAEAVVHNSCTTGVEAWLLGRPVFAYVPFRNDLYDSKLPNGLSEQLESIRDLIEALRVSVETPRAAVKDAPRKDLAARYLEGIDGEPAADRIVSDMLACCDLPSRRPPALQAFSETARRIARKIPGLRLSPEMIELKRKKFPGTTPVEVDDQLSLLTRLRPELGGTTCRPYRNIPNTFEIRFQKK